MQSIFITGAAQGIGKAVAEKFLAAGWLVGAYDIAPVEWANGIDNVVTGHINVIDAQSWEDALADFVAHTGGHIDVLDNNAGIIVDGNLTDSHPAALSRLIDVNCTGVTLGARAAHKYLRKGSTLVNMCSASAIYGQPGIATYSATKFYVAGLTEALELEWRKDKIRVVAIWPLWAKTPLADVDATSVKRLGVNIAPEEVAATVYAAANPKNIWQRGKIHYGVSTMDKVMYVARSLTPDRVARLVNLVVTR